MRIQSKKIFHSLLMLISLVALTACGGGGGDGSSGDYGDNDASPTLSGISAKGIIKNGVVTAYEVGSSGEVLRVIGTTTTNATGQYSLSLTDTYEGGVIRVEVTPGTSTKMVCDVFDGCGGVLFGGDMDLPEGFAMEALVPSVNVDKEVDVQITPFTHMAAARVRGGEEFTPSSVENAYGEISQVVGIDVLKTPMVNIANPAELEAASPASKQYALFCSGIAEELDLDSGTDSLNENLEKLAHSFDDGEFTNSDSVGITEILDSVKSATNGAKNNSATTEVMSDSINAVEVTIEAIEADVVEGGFDPEPSDNYLPLVSAGSDVEANFGAQVIFDANGSSDSDGSIITYEWKEGEVVLSTSERFSKTDLIAGTHVITLTVVDDDDGAATDTVTVIINGVPVADAGEDVAVNTGDVVTLDANGSYDSDGIVASYEWKEGETVLSTAVSFSKSDFSEGTHTLTLTVTDNDGATATDTVAVDVNYAPVANAGSDSTMIAGAGVDFDASSSTDSDGIIASYQWKEGETVLSAAASFTKSDFTAGTHTVTLTVTDDGGATATDDVTVNINIPPLANAGADNFGNMIDIITLDASGSNDIDGTITSYLWKEGEDILSTAASFTKSDFPAGAHIVTLTVIDNDGATATDTVVITIINVSPVAKAGLNVTVNIGEAVLLNASASTDTDGTIVSYQWEKGETVLSTAASFNYLELTVGIHTIILSVTDNGGATATDTVDVTINNPPVASAGQDVDKNWGEEVTLNASGSTDSDGTIAGYQWKEGGTVLSTSVSFTKSDLTGGVHTVTLTVTDNGGATATDTVVVTINNPPTADAGADVRENWGETVTFNASASTDSDGTIVSYEWKEGETVLSTAVSFTKSDFIAGMHSVTLTVTDNGGATATDNVIVAINVIPVAHAGEDVLVLITEPVMFDASGSIDSDGTIVSYEWKEGDVVLSTAASFTKFDFALGIHSIELTVTDDDGAAATDDFVIIVNNPPVADAGEDVSVNPEADITLDASDSNDSDGTIVSYEWKEGEAVLSIAESFTKSDFTWGFHTITLTVTDNYGAIVTDDVLVTIEMALNDTAIRWCANADTNNLSCAQEGFPNQDAENGRDKLASTGDILKIGEGCGGFDYTKICNSGEAAGEGSCPNDPILGTGNNDWACTRDNVTNMIWEVKTTSGLRNTNNTYSWYNSDSNFNGGSVGTQNGGVCTGSNCDTQAFVQAVNAEDLCGINNWRIPAKQELMGIVYNGFYNFAIETAHFPNTQNSWYWTSLPDDNYAAGVNFMNGEVKILGKNDGGNIRLVSGYGVDGTQTTCADTASENTGIPSSTPTAAFTVHDNGTISHHASGLMWMRCSIGQTWNGSNCIGEASRYIWQDALQAVGGYSFAGYSDWRIPNKNELASIVEDRCRQPSINAEIFPNTVPEWYWSSSPYVDSGSRAWTVYFASSYFVVHSAKVHDSWIYPIRLVRDRL